MLPIIRKRWSLRVGGRIPEITFNSAPHPPHPFARQAGPTEKGGVEWSVV